MKRPIVARSATDLANRVLGGRYRIEEPIGSGGMGHVFRATQLDLGRRVALKILSDVRSSDVDIARFEREARLAAGLGHPHIVQVTDFHAGGSDDGDDPSFLVMELLEGKSLGALVRAAHPLSEERVVRIGLQILSALGAAHHAGLVHRDVKPANVVLVASPAGDLVKVVDFGLARAVEPTMDAPLSKAGVIVGTPSFMAPEQARGERLDGRADVYGIAATLYYALTAHLPVPVEAERAEQLAAVLARKEPTPLATYRSDVDPRLAEIVMRGLEKDRARRFQTAEEMTTALENWLIARGMPETVSIVADTVRDPPLPLPVPVESTLVSTPKKIKRAAPSRMGIFLASAGIVVLLGSAAVAAHFALGNPPVAVVDAAPSVATTLVATDGGESEDAAVAVALSDPSSSASSASSASSVPSVSTAKLVVAAPRKTFGKACASSLECANASEQCIDGACACRVGWDLKVCDRECVSLPRDGDHCGTCGHACARDERCVDGNCMACTKAFPNEPVTICSLAHVCVRLDRDARHCGACGKSCASSEICVLGRCRAK